MPRGTSLYDTAGLQGRLSTPVLLRGMSKLYFWYDAADRNTISASTGAVDTWRDKSGNARNATQAGGNRLAWNDNGWIAPTVNYPAIIPNGTSHWFNISAIGGQTRSIQAVVRNSGAATSRALISGNGGAFELLITSGQNLRVARFGQATIATSTATLATGFCMIGADTDTNRTDLWINGALEASSANGAYVQNLTLIATAGGPADLFDAAIGEIVYNDVCWSAAETAKVQGYLAWKWGLVANLPASHSYKAMPPLLGT
jgi:hypothetical protein